MLVGPRFSPRTPEAEVIQGVLSGAFETGMFAPRLPAELTQILERTTQLDPDRRPGDLAALAFDLRRAALVLGAGDGRVFLRKAIETRFGEPARSPRARAG
jgi:hypothetical protein